MTLTKSSYQALSTIACCYLAFTLIENQLKNTAAVKATNEWKTEAFLQLFQAQFNPHFFPPSSISRRSHAHIFNPHLLEDLSCMFCFWLGGEESLRSDSDCWRFSHHSFHTLQLAHLNFISFFSKKLNIKKSVVAKSLSPLFSLTHSLASFSIIRWWLWNMCFAFEIHLLFFSLG